MATSGCRCSRESWCPRRIQGCRHVKLSNAEPAGKAQELAGASGGVLAFLR